MRYTDEGLPIFETLDKAPFVLPRSEPPGYQVQHDFPAALFLMPAFLLLVAATGGIAIVLFPVVVLIIAYAEMKP